MYESNSCKGTNNSPRTSNFCYYFGHFSSTNMGDKKNLKKKKKRIRKIITIPAVCLHVLPGSISSEITKLTYCVKLNLKLIQTLFSVQLNCLPIEGFLNFKLALASAKLPEISYP